MICLLDPFTISLMKNTAPPNQPPQLTVQHKRVQRIWSRGQPDESQVKKPKNFRKLKLNCQKNNFNNNLNF